MNKVVIMNRKSSFVFKRQPRIFEQIGMILVLSFLFGMTLLFAESTQVGSPVTELPAYGQRQQFSCGDELPMQILMIAQYESAKEVVLEKLRDTGGHEEPKYILQIAEQSMQNFVRTGCKNYYLEGVFLYKSYFENWRKVMQNRVNHATQRLYQKWGERIAMVATDEYAQFLASSAKFKPAALDLNRFKYDFLQEKFKVDDLMKRKNRWLAVSVTTTVIGLVLSSVGGYLLSLDGKEISNSNCTSALGLTGECVNNTRAPALALIGIGVSLIVGGATGMGITLY